MKIIIVVVTLQKIPALSSFTPKPISVKPYLLYPMVV